MPAKDTARSAAMRYIVDHRFELSLRPQGSNMTYLNETVLRYSAKRCMYHDAVRNALIKDGWTITDDPLILSIGKKDLFVDLGAEKLIAAQKDHQRIAVEIKSFIGLSRVNDLEKALGQYVLYGEIILDQQENRVLYLAIKQSAYEDIFEQPIGQLLLRRNIVKLLVFNEIEEVILEWIQ